MAQQNRAAKDPDPRNIKREIHRRVAFLYLLFGALSVAIIGQIVLTQIGPNGEGLRNLSEVRCYTTREVEGSQGNVYDRHGSLLSTDTRGYRLRLDLHAEALTDELFAAELPALCDSLSAMFGKKPSHYRELFTATRRRALNKEGKSPYNQPFIPGVLNQREYDRLKSFPLMERKYGLVVNEAPLRHKVHGSLASYTISRGVEREYADVLEATNGVNRFVWLDARKRNSVPIVDPINTPASNGSNIITTIDIELQDVVEAALKRQLEANRANDGTAVVVECSTGEIRAMANLTRHSEGNVQDDFNYALQWQGAPGSTFKGVSLMALVDEAGLSIEKRVNCGTKESVIINGTKVTDTHVVGEKSGKTTLKGIFAESSNIGFAKTVMEVYGEEPERWVEYINAIGLDKIRNIQRLKGYGFRGIKHPSSYKQAGGWSRTTLVQTAYGYEMDMTPLQVLMFYNAVANNGQLITPVLVKSIERDGEILEQFATEVINPAICSPEALAKVRECMEAVVSDKLGTAHRQLSGLPFKVAGKTGTAQVMLAKEKRGKTAYVDTSGNKEYLATFVGYFPADNPKYTCIVAIKTPKGYGEVKYYTGAGVSLPVFREIAEYIYYHDPEWYVEATPTVTTTPLSHKPAQAALCEEGMVPDVVGMGLRDALYEMESRGIEVEFEGTGSVKNQSVKAGEAIEPDTRVKLTLGI